MTNYVSANPIPAGERFAVFRDADGEPGVFALSEDLYLYLVMVIDGKAERIDFGNTSGIVPKGVKVQAFAVVQAPDSTLDICIATPGAGETSNFTLLHNITLSELKGSIPSSKVLRGSNFPSVHHIFMVSYPWLYDVNYLLRIIANLSRPTNQPIPSAPCLWPW